MVRAQLTKNGKHLPVSIRTPSKRAAGSGPPRTFKYDAVSVQRYLTSHNLEIVELKTSKRDSRVRGTCSCGESFERAIREVIQKERVLCRQCTVRERNRKARETNLERYGVEYISQSEEVRAKVRRTTLERYGVENVLQSAEVKKTICQTNLERRGVEYPMQSNECKAKARQTNIGRYGADYPMQSKQIKEKARQTNIGRYGAENPFQSEQIKEKIRQTNNKHRGVDYPMQSNEVKDNARQTFLERYGVENPMQSEQIKEKSRQTTFEHYGVEHAFQSEELKEKARKTNLERYGAENPMQNANVAARSLAAAHTRKTFTFPSGRVVNVQGYEPFALKIVLSRHAEEGVIVGTSNVPEIWWTDDAGKRHRYYTDIYTLSDRKCIEVKSAWTFRPELRPVVLAKQLAAKAAGYQCEIWVMDDKGGIVELIA